jgi:copper ion binding protein
MNAARTTRKELAMTERSYSVPGISCDHCKAAIEREVGRVAGVEHVDVDVAAKRVTVVGADDPEIRAAIGEAGYDIAEP